jgi:hypothetical protein
MKWLLLYYSKFDRYTRCFQTFKTKEEAIEYKNNILHDYDIIGIVELKEPIYL